MWVAVPQVVLGHVMRDNAVRGKKHALTTSARLACFVCVLQFRNQQPLLLILRVNCIYKARQWDNAARCRRCWQHSDGHSACVDAGVCKVRPDVTEAEPLTFLTLPEKVLEACRLDATTVR